LSKADGVAANFLSPEEKVVAMGRPEIRRLKKFEEENSKLKRLVADLSLYKTRTKISPPENGPDLVQDH